MSWQPKKKIIEVSEPVLNNLEALYVRTYLSTLSHGKAYQITQSSSNPNNHNNKYARSENVKYHISKEIQSKYEALHLDEDTIISLLYKEATDRGEGSSHGSRITALTLLGKEIGMFSEKKEEANLTYNIVNYQAQPTVQEEEDKLITKEEQKEDIPVGNKQLNITEYK